MGRRFEGKIYFVIMKISDLQRVTSTLLPFVERTGVRTDDGNTGEFRETRISPWRPLETKCMIYVMLTVVKEKKKKEKKH